MKMDLEEFGEDIDLSEWELIDSQVVESLEDEERLDAELESVKQSAKIICFQKFMILLATGGGKAKFEIGARWKDCL